MSDDITIGRCLPPSWPRPPRPPVEEPVPESLDETVEWKTWSHPELYRMVHEGIDTAGAMAVSATWARMGQELSELGDELNRLLLATAQAWEGDAAELAKESVSSLADWSGETGQRATEVSACVTIQVDNVTNARNDMPPPPYPMAYPADDVELPSQITAFTTNDFELAKPLVVDPMIYTTQERELHEQAARTMERFQANSRDVYETVPQFAPPSLRKMPYGPPPPEQPPQPQPQPPVPTPTPTPTPRMPVTGGPAAAGGPGGAGPGSSGRAPAAAPLAPGGGTGGAEPAAKPAAASAVPVRSGTQSQGMPGGMPMGGGGARGGEDTERGSNKYVEEDPDIWGAHDERVMPPVIGEVNRRA